MENSLMSDIWKIPHNMDGWLPPSIKNWIAMESQIIGVPEAYLAFPLLSITAHLGQFATVYVNSRHSEPLILYTVVAGYSGTNKSSSLNMFTKYLEKICPGSRFDTGTLDGLAAKMAENKGSVIAINDEFSTFMEGIDSGKNQSSDKSRILTLFGGSSWSKKTKTSGSFNFSSTHFNLLSTTQPDFLVQFARNKLHQSDGFFPRFLLACPSEVYIKKHQQREALAQLASSDFDMERLLQNIF